MRRALLLLAVFAACHQAEPAKTATGREIDDAKAQAKPKSPIVVAIVVDQLAAWILSERLPLLRPEGGFARLAREGTWVREMRFAHAACDTAPGHSSLYTGAPPHENGIFVNEILDSHFEKISILADPTATQIDAAGVRAGESSSAAKVRLPTVADELRKAHPDAVIISLSLKDRGAIFGGGKDPTDVVWYDAGKGVFVTSSAFAQAPVPWLEASSKLDHQPLARSAWDAPLRSDWVRAHALTADAQNGEGDYLGLKATYPHDIASTAKPTKAFRMTPFSDRVLFSMALRALDARKAIEHPTLVALSLSANDYIGHTFGPDSWESWDELDRLDVELGSFLRALDERYGQEGHTEMLTADHGVTPMPETAKSGHAWCEHPEKDRWKRACTPGERLVPPKLGQELQDAAMKAIGPGKWVAGIADPYVVLTGEARKLPRENFTKLVSAIVSALQLHPGVDRVIDSFRATCPPESDESIDALVCRSHVEGSPVDLYILTKPGSFFDPGYTEGFGTSHGNPGIFDRAVPLLVRAPKRADAARIIEEPTSYRVFARTLSALLDISPLASVKDAASLVR